MLNSLEKYGPPQSQDTDLFCIGEVSFGAFKLLYGVTNRCVINSQAVFPGFCGTRKVGHLHPTPKLLPGRCTCVEDKPIIWRYPAGAVVDKRQVLIQRFQAPTAEVLIEKTLRRKDPLKPMGSSTGM